MPNTPKLPEDDEKRFDDRFGFLNNVIERLGYQREINWSDEAKRFIAEELATLKAQVRKEIEGKRFENHEWEQMRRQAWGYNQALTDCLSIPSLKGEE